MIFLTFLFVGARIYTQLRVTRLFGLSDYLMICSVAILTSFASLISVQHQFGWGRHQSCTSPVSFPPEALKALMDILLTRNCLGIEDLSELETQIKFNVAGQGFGIMGSTFARTSFIVFMIALFGSRPWVKWTLWTLFVAQFLTNGLTCILVYAQCKDPRALYIFTLPEDLCWPSYIQTVSSVVRSRAQSSYLLILYPFYLLARSQINVRGPLSRHSILVGPTPLSMVSATLFLPSCRLSWSGIST